MKNGLLSTSLSSVAEGGFFGAASTLLVASAEVSIYIVTRYEVPADLGHSTWLVLVACILGWGLGSVLGGAGAVVVRGGPRNPDSLLRWNPRT